MGKQPLKTNAARALDRRQLAYEVLTYDVDPNDLAAESVAAKLRLAPAQVFKTLVTRGDRQGICFAVIPGNVALELKALAKVSGDRQQAIVALKDVQPLTGYIRGGVTAIASKKAYPVYLHDTAMAWDEIILSAGKRGFMLKLTPSDYIQATGATVGVIARPKA